MSQIEYIYAEITEPKQLQTCSGVSVRLVSLLSISHDTSSVTMNTTNRTTVRVYTTTSSSNKVTISKLRNF